MSKNIVIQEGGVGRQFTAQKLTTPLLEGGSCNWVPEDEVQLGTKSITENGTYVAANDGEYGYSQVTVNVNSTTKIITGSTNDGTPAVATIDVVDGNISQIILGDYFIVTYDEDGKVAKIEDNNGNACTLAYDGEILSGFDDVEDNHYTIILDSDGNISQVIDPNAQDCELRDSDGDGKIDIISIGTVLSVIPDIETGDIKIIDENDNDVTDDYIGTSITGVDSSDTPWRANITDSTSGDGASMGITPVTPATTPGASIVGTNSDGDITKITIGDDGSLEQEILPHHIEVTTIPSRTDYYEGQDIVYDGLVVKAFTRDGSIWTNETHPDGIIPISELTLPLEKAVITGDYDTIWSDEDGKINAVEVTCNEQGGTYASWMFYYYGGNLGSNGAAGTTGMCSEAESGVTFLITQYNNGLYVMTLYEDTPKNWTLGGFKDGAWRMRHSSYLMETAPLYKFGGSRNSGTYFGVYDLSNVPVSTIDPSGVEDIDLDAKHIIEQVPVQWYYGSGVALETSYEIDVETWPYDTPTNEE